MYGIDLHSNKDGYFKFGNNKCQIFALLPFERQITVSEVSPVGLELVKFKSDQLNRVEVSIHLTDKQAIELSTLLYGHKAFAFNKVTLGRIIGH
ncbi:hypothetical protein O181_010742 [Austropuccinia psidii MF-1]|uniref:Uncharacterized protein n=1 Tax=Austropuccinia psidii MF-1 TaxID=1389203 RepID=A0A9Q3GLH4_9BASI|nr:hypothetical protein [Austropuccinia psidii MF-1]